MADMNIRNVEGGLLARMKAKAEANGMTLRCWVLWVASVALGEVGAQVAVSVPAEKVKRPAKVASDAPAACRRCDSAVLRDERNPKYWYCYRCKRQLDQGDIRQ